MLFENAEGFFLLFLRTSQRLVSKPRKHQGPRARVKHEEFFFLSKLV